MCPRPYPKPEPPATPDDAPIWRTTGPLSAAPNRARAAPNRAPRYSIRPSRSAGIRRTTHYLFVRRDLDGASWRRPDSLVSRLFRFHGRAQTLPEAARHGSPLRATAIRPTGCVAALTPCSDIA